MKKNMDSAVGYGYLIISDCVRRGQRAGLGFRFSTRVIKNRKHGRISGGYK